jgi:CO/xanthine dehydrogenase FAD-binding subunit
MFANVEAFYRPATVPEALRLLQRAKGHACVVAGGTDLAVGEDRSVRILIDITRAGLSYVRAKASRGKSFVIGATTTMAELESSPVLRKVAGGLLCRAAASCGSVEIRNVATIGGNMAHASPAADLATPLLVLDAQVVLAGARGRRRLLLSEFLANPHAVERQRELLIEIAISEPAHGRGCGWSFQKFGRTAVDLSVVNVAAGLELDARRRVKWARLAFGAVAPAPFRALAAEKRITGRVLDRALLAELGDEIVRELRPITDQRASADYRRELARVLTGRAIEECAAQAGFSL